MSTTPTIRRSSFSSESSLDLPLTRSRSVKKYAKKLSYLLSPTLKVANDTEEVKFAINATPPLNKPMVVTSPTSASGPKRAISRGEKAFAALTESWKAGVDTMSYERASNISSPQYTPIKDLQQAQSRRRAERDALEVAPGRIEYLLYIGEGIGPPVEYCSIVETMCLRPSEVSLFKVHALMIGEGEEAKCFF